MANISDIVNSKTNQVTLEGTRTNVVDNSVLGMTSTITGFNSPIVTGYAYRDSQGNYRLNASGQFKFTLTTSISGTVSFAGVQPKLTQKQPVTTNMELSTVYNIANTVTADNGTFFSVQSTIISGSAQSDGGFFSFDVELKERPSWFDDNLMTSSGLPVATADTYGVVKQTISGWSADETFSVGGDTTAPTLGTVQHSVIRWRRVGTDAEFFFNYRQSTAGANGSGDYFIHLPTNFVANYSIDTSFFNQGNANSSNIIGTMMYNDNANNTNDHAILYWRLGDTTTIRIKVTSNNANGNVWNSGNVPTYNASQLELTGRFTLPIVEFT